MRIRKIIKLKDGGVLLYRRDKSNNYSHVKVGFRVGSGNNEKNGVAHFFEHMLFEGTTTRSKEQLLKDNENICYLNASTSTNTLLVRFNRTNRLIKESFESASDLLLNSKLDENAIEMTRKVIENEYLRSIDSIKSSPASLFVAKFTSLPKPRKSLGNSQDLANITKEDLVNFKDRYFNRKNFLMVYVGNLKKGKVVKLANKNFIDKLKTDGEQTPEKMDVKVEKAPALAFTQDETNQAKILILFPYKADFYDEKVKIMNKLIARHCRRNPNQFYNTLRNKGLVYSADVACSGNDDLKFLGFLIETKNETIFEALDVLKQSIELLKSKDISPEEFETMKNNLIYGYDQTTQADKGQRAAKMLSQYIYTGNIHVKSSNKCIDIIKKLQLNELNDYIDTMLPGNNLPYVVVIGDKEAEKISYRDVVGTVCPEMVNYIKPENEVVIDDAEIEK